MKVKHIFLAILVVMIWGGNFVFSRYAVMHFGPLMTMGIRLVMVGLCIIPFTKFPKISKKEMLKISFINGVLHHGFIFTAIGSSLTISTIVVLNQLNVPFSSMLAYFWLNDKIKLQRFIGILICFLGVFIIFGAPEFGRDHLIGIACVILGALTMAITNIQIKQLGNFDAIPFLGWVSLMASPFLIVASLLIEPFSFENFKNIPPKVCFSLGYMLISSIVGYGIWFSLLQRYSVNLISPFTLLTPIFGMAIASLVLSETITRELIIGASVTLIGVAIITIRRPDYVNTQET